MRALLCLDGTNTERLAQWTFQHLKMQEWKIVLLHVVDSSPGQELERLRQRFSGKPEQEIVRTAGAISIDLILLCARRALQPGEPPHPTGPKSVGHTARFVLDHAPRPVLLLRP